MLEGLEISEIRLRSVNLGDRADAEYFSKENLRIDRALAEHGAKKLGELCTLKASAFYPAATDLYEEGEVPFARCVDCIAYPVITTQQDATFVRVPQWFVEGNKQIDTVSTGDVILTKVGSPCYASVVHEHQRIALSRTVLGLAAIQDVDPYYLVAFLRGRYGFTQLQLAGVNYLGRSTTTILAGGGGRSCR